MKKSFGAIRPNINTADNKPGHLLRSQVTAAHFIVLFAILFTGCKKYETQPNNGSQVASVSKLSADMEVLTYYRGLGKETLQELQQARAATAPAPRPAGSACASAPASVPLARTIGSPTSSIFTPRAGAPAACAPPSPRAACRA